MPQLGHSKITNHTNEQTNHERQPFTNKIKERSWKKTNHSPDINYHVNCINHEPNKTESQNVIHLKNTTKAMNCSQWKNCIWD